MITMWMLWLKIFVATLLNNVELVRLSDFIVKLKSQNFVELWDISKLSRERERGRVIEGVPWR